MTFSEKRKALRAFRQHADAIRAFVNSYRIGALPDGVTITLPAEDFDAVQFGLSHLKTWIPELDDEQEVIPGKGRWTRMNFCFTSPRIKAENLLVKCIPVLRGEG